MNCLGLVFVVLLNDFILSDPDTAQGHALIDLQLHILLISATLSHHLEVVVIVRLIIFIMHFMI